MNGVPYLLPGARFGLRLGDAKLIDSTVADGLWCSIEDCHMGTHAERVAIKDHVSREDQDAFALASHQRAIAASMAAGSTLRWRGHDHGRQGRETLVDTDGTRAATPVPSARAAQAAFALPRARIAVGARPAPSPPATRRASRWCGRDGRCQRARGRTARPQALARIVGYAQAESPEVVVPGAGRGRQAPARPHRAADRGVAWSRSTRRLRPRRSRTAASSGSTGTRSTGTAARSRSGTRSAPAAHGSWDTPPRA